MGKDQTVPKLRQSARANRRPSHLLAQIPHPQMQAAFDPPDTGSDPLAAPCAGRREVGGESGAEVGAQGQKEGSHAREESGGGSQGGEGDREGID